MTASTPALWPARAHRDARGVVMIEFLTAFGPLLLVFLAALQLALIGSAELIVRHAAVAGVRAAIVVLDDDPRFYAGAARGVLGDTLEGSRMAAIRRAVHARTAAIPTEVAMATTVALPIAPGAAARFEERVEPSATLSLRVTHRFACWVPVVSALLCTRVKLHGIAERTIEAEATLPAQDAPYRYASERASKAAP